MANSALYQDRRTWLIEVAEVSGIKLKLYGMCGDGLTIESITIDNAKAFVQTKVAFPEKATHGFLVLHHGEEAMWLLVDWWVEDILHQRLFYAPKDNVDSFQIGPPNHEMACVWELLVVSHERDAWVRHTMMDPANADFSAYLSDTLTIG
jgi:hypothetical protein